MLIINKEKISPVKKGGPEGIYDIFNVKFSGILNLEIVLTWEQVIKYILCKKY